MFGLSLTKTMGLGLTLKTWLYIALAGIAVLGAAYGAGYGFGHGAGEAKATRADAATAAKLAKQVAADKLAQSRALAAANEKNRQLERDNAKAISDLRATFAAEQAKQAADDAAALARLRDGNQRLRFQVAAYRSAASSTGDAAGPGVDGAGIAELAPATSEALYSIAADGDRSIRKLIALQGWARETMKVCKANSP